MRSTLKYLKSFETPISRKRYWKECVLLVVSVLLCGVIIEPIAFVIGILLNIILPGIALIFIFYLPMIAFAGWNIASAIIFSALIARRYKRIHTQTKYIWLIWLSGILVALGLEKVLAASEGATFYISAFIGKPEETPIPWGIPILALFILTAVGLVPDKTSE